MATRGSYVHNYGRIFGGMPKFQFYTIFSENLWFQTEIHNALTLS